MGHDVMKVLILKCHTSKIGRKKHYRRESTKEPEGVCSTQEMFKLYEY